MLYLIATPIGNLSDFSFRAIETLRNCDYLLCEDTRHSLKLLNHYQIQKPLRSYHQFNEAASEKKILTSLKDGQVVGLMTDAGTPCLADPGERLVKACIREQIEVQAIPGPCAFIMALICSGFSTERFQFVGFLPVKKGGREKRIVEMLDYKGTSIAYETPHRILGTLEILAKNDPHRQLVIARELTKKFEQFLRGTAFDLTENFKTKPPKGEMVLLTSPPPSKKSSL